MHTHAHKLIQAANGGKSEPHLHSVSFPVVFALEKCSCRFPSLLKSVVSILRRLYSFLTVPKFQFSNTPFASIFSLPIHPPVALSLSLDYPTQRSKMRA